MDQTETLLHPITVAAQLGCRPKTIHRWIAEGALPAIEIGPPGRQRRRWRIPASALERLLQERMRARDAHPVADNPKARAGDAGTRG